MTNSTAIFLAFQISLFGYWLAFLAKNLIRIEKEKTESIAERFLIFIWDVLFPMSMMFLSSSIIMKEIAKIIG
jgi:hypothetical protein